MFTYQRGKKLEPHAVETMNNNGCHYVKAKVRVHCYADGGLAVFHGPRKLTCFDRKGKIATQPLKQAA